MTIQDFENKILPFSARIYPMAARMLGNKEIAEDAVQEIMLKLWDRRRKIKNHPNIPGYVFSTARNYCLDQLKKKSPDITSSDIQLNMLKSNTSHDHAEWKELITIVKSILKELPQLQCEVMIMRDIDGFEYAEIARIKNLKVEYVRVLLSRARKHVGLKLKTIYSYE